jgi:hypothetical protein
MLENVRSFRVGVGVGVGVNTGVGVGVGIKVGVGVEVGSGIGVEVGDGDTTGDGLMTATPLFQTSFVPDLTQVNFFPDAVAVDPAFVHLAPALGAAALSGVARDTSNATITTRPNFLSIVMAS